MKQASAFFEQNSNVKSEIQLIKFSNVAPTENQRSNFIQKLKRSNYRYGGETADSSHYISRPF